MAIPTASRRATHHRLVQLRIEAGLTPNDLAARAGVSGKTVRMTEAGFIPGPRVQFKIAGVFRLSPLELWPYERGRQRVAA